MYIYICIHIFREGSLHKSRALPRSAEAGGILLLHATRFRSQEEIGCDRHQWSVSGVQSWLVLWNMNGL